MDHAGRVARLSGQLDCPLLVTSLPNIRYLTGFTGSNAYFLAKPDGSVLVTDTRYGEAAEALVEALPQTDLVVYYGTLWKTLGEVLAGIPEVALEATNVSWDFVRSAQERLDTVVVARAGAVESLRLVKDEDEVTALRAAAAAGDTAFASVPGLRSNAATEAELGWGLINVMRETGGKQAAWDPIVAAGANASVPHHRAGPDPLGDGLLLLDYGCTVDGYHSDMSRTIWIGGSRPDEEILRMYGAVLDAQRAGIAAVRPGATAASVDEACREVLRGYELEDRFLHSTGHGVGLEIHEAPKVGRDSEDVLEPGHVITVEPGVYVPGKGGVRIEDMILVTEDGGEELTHASKELQIG